MTKKNNGISTDYRQRDEEPSNQSNDNNVTAYEAMTKPVGAYAEFYKNAVDQEQKNAILKAHDIAFAESLAGNFSNKDLREENKLNIFIGVLRDLGYKPTAEDPLVLERMASAINLPLVLTTNFSFDEKTYRRVRKKVNFISTTSITELLQSTDDVIDDGEFIPLSIRRTVTSSVDQDKVILMTKKVHHFLTGLQLLINRNDNRSFAIERLFEALIADFEDFHEASSQDEVYNLGRLSALLVAERARTIQQLDKAYEALHEYVGGTKPKPLSKRKGIFNLQKEKTEIIQLFTYNTDVSIKFNDEQFYLNILEVV